MLRYACVAYLVSLVGTNACCSLYKSRKIGWTFAGVDTRMDRHKVSLPWLWHEAIFVGHQLQGLWNRV
jgi:hypothetical protein